MRKIWVIFGTTGEYSDRTEWMVRAFADEAKAKEFCNRLLDTVRGSRQWSHEKRWHFKSELDPDLTHIDYTGADYFIGHVDLED